MNHQNVHSTHFFESKTVTNSFLTGYILFDLYLNKKAEEELS